MFIHSSSSISYTIDVISLSFKKKTKITTDSITISSLSFRSSGRFPDVGQANGQQVGAAETRTLERAVGFVQQQQLDAGSIIVQFDLLPERVNFVDVISVRVER